MRAASALLAFVVATGTAQGDTQTIIVQSTTSTANSGLYDAILPLAEAATGVRAQVVAVGTGQAIRNARNCDGDLLIVHAREAEEAFVASGFGTARHALMYNDFVIVGPEADPAGIGSLGEVSAALAQIAAAEAPFASRGDTSGTHLREMALWEAAGVDPLAAAGDWYLEMGSGMGATLNSAIGLEAYTLVDRASWLSFANRLDFVIHVEGDPTLFNPYGVIPVSPEACPNVRAGAARALTDWLLSDAGQAAIGAFRIGGVQVFVPNADDAD